MSIARVLIMMSVVLTVLGSVHYYLWVRLVRDTGMPPPWPTWLGWLLIGLLAAIPVSILSSRSLPPGWSSPWFWGVFSWVGVMFFLLVLLLPTELIRGGWAAADWWRDGPAVDPERRLFLTRAAAMAVGFGAFGLSATGLVATRGAIAVKRVAVSLAQLSPALAGFRIVQISDVHVGQTIGQGFIEALVAQINALQPDLIAITGDLVDGSVANIGAAVAPLAGLRAPHGVFFVTGNHEYYSAVTDWLPFLTGLGIRVLRNERVPIEQAGAGFDLAGIDDFLAEGFGHGPDLPKALAGRDPDRPVVLLAHQPRAIFEAARLGVSLQLSGHTHGGQIFPFNYLVKLQQPYVSGLHRHGDSQIYVSRGTGYWGPPMRVGAPPEVTCIELSPA
ncbi:MAG: metallophosphoesterase [Candidatus Sericytochromatia bacterium]|nr:metallophosphoesterase [Candidatus Sericytochromatia bacterium]